MDWKLNEAALKARPIGGEIKVEAGVLRRENATQFPENI